MVNGRNVSAKMVATYQKKNQYDFLDKQNFKGYDDKRRVNKKNFINFAETSSLHYIARKCIKR